MSNYQGPAVVVLDSGRELDVTANLRNGPDGLRTSWGGILSVPNGSTPIELFNLQQGTLRIGDREAAFVRPDISDWMENQIDAYRMTIVGNGDEPF